VKGDTLVKIIAIISLTILEAIALWRGIDGTLFSLVVGTIAGLAGYQFGRYKTERCHPRSSRDSSRTTEHSESTSEPPTGFIIHLLRVPRAVTSGGQGMVGYTRVYTWMASGNNGGVVNV